MRKKRVVFLLSIGVILLLVAVSKPVLLFVAKRLIENKLAKLEEIKVDIETITSGVLEGITLKNVKVGFPHGSNFMTAGTIKVDFSLVDMLLGRVGPWEIEISRMYVTFSSKDTPRLKELFTKKGVTPLFKSKVKEKMGIPVPHAIHLDGRLEFHFEGFPSIVLEDCVLDASKEEKGATGNMSFTLFVEQDWSSRATGTLLLQHSGFSAEVRLARPFDLRSITKNELLSVLSAGGFAVDYSDGIFTLSLVDVVSTTSGKKDDISFELVRVNRLSLSTRKESLGELFSGEMSAINSVALSGGALTVTIKKMGLGEFEVRHLNMTIENKGQLVLQGDGEIKKGNSRASKFRISSSIDMKTLNFDANGAVEGDFLVHLAHGVHKRVLAWPRSSLSLNFSAKGSIEEFSISGHMSGKSLAYFWTKLCLVPIYPVDFDVDFAMKANLSKGTLRLTLDPLFLGLSQFAINADFKSFRKPLVFTIRLTIPKQPCDTLFRSIPPVLVPRLDGAMFGGTVAGEFELIVDKQKLERSKLNVSIDHEECRAITLGPLVDVEKMNSPKFVHKIVEEDLKSPILVGPGTDSYVPIQEIPFHVQQAALATEDMAFFRHEGFRIGLINRAIRLNLDYGWYVYGGSTISQQLVKNLFLSTEKTLARKLEEAIIVWEMEKKVEKERILELYLNCIEFGKHIYGIKAAAQAYFNKEPKDLTPLEAAFIMATKPAPRYAYNVYKSRKFNKWWVERMQGILTRLWKEMHVLDEEQARTPDPCPPGSDHRPEFLIPCFYYPEEDAYMPPKVEADFVRPEGMPKALPGGEKTEETQNNPR